MASAIGWWVLGGVRRGGRGRGSLLFRSRRRRRRLPPTVPRGLPSLVGLLIDHAPSVCGPTITRTMFPSLTTRLCRMDFRCMSNMRRRTALVGILVTPANTKGDYIGTPVGRVVTSVHGQSRIGLRQRGR